MFMLKDFQTFYNILSTGINRFSIGSDTYVYIEDTNEIFNIQQRHWNRSEESNLFPYDIIKVVVPEILVKQQKEHVISLWTTATTAIGIK